MPNAGGTIKHICEQYLISFVTQPMILNLQYAYNEIGIWLVGIANNNDGLCGTICSIFLTWPRKCLCINVSAGIIYTIICNPNHFVFNRHQHQKKSQWCHIHFLISHSNILLFNANGYICNGVAVSIQSKFMENFVSLFVPHAFNLAWISPLSAIWYRKMQKPLFWHSESFYKVQPNDMKFYTMYINWRCKYLHIVVYA